MTHLADGSYKRALSEADHAVLEADKLGDLSLAALTLSGRAEIRVLDGDAAFGRGEVERALANRRKIGDVVGEAQDERILGMALAGSGELLEAEELLRSVITKAEKLGRPHLAATAGRELADVLKRAGRMVEAKVVARETQRRFESLGAFTEAEKLEGFIEN
jgi:tetratricopeptide (TPR) repeat protein